MSYCRFSTSDAYIIHHCDGFVRCYSCRLDPERDVFDSPTFSGMAEHVREHVAAGHRMPGVLEALLADAAVCDDAAADDEPAPTGYQERSILSLRRLMREAGHAL